MAYFFGDSFDLYQGGVGFTDFQTFWDGMTGGANYFNTLSPGRFPGGQALYHNSYGMAMYKNGQNDAVHHICCAIYQTVALGGVGTNLYFQFGDTSNAQCCIVFRTDGAILLTSGGPSGTTLDTYTGAITAINTWTAFEFEVVINNTTGSWTVRKNGNTSNDHQLGSLNTRGGSTNNYANRMSIGYNGGGAQIAVDDFLWRSDAATVSWAGDIRCYVRRPASDVSVQWTPGSTTLAVTPYTATSTVGINANQARYFPFTTRANGTIGSATIAFYNLATGNYKLAIYASDGTNPAGGPGTVLATSNTVNNPGGSTATFTFASPPTVTVGNTYYLAMNSDAGGNVNATAASLSTCYFQNSATFGTWPTANPNLVGSSGVQADQFTVIVTLSTPNNYPFVNEQVEDGSNSYVQTNAVGANDLYGISSIGVTPTAVLGVITRGYLQKSDAGSRLAAVQIKSGATTVNSGGAPLTTTWGWMYRIDTTDPNTGSPWTAIAVNNAQIGAVVTA